jgi:hypothetical protein
MKQRPSKDTDQENAQKAFDMLCDLARINPEIEGSIWISAFYSCIVASFVNTGLTYENFCVDMKGAMEKYKSWFDEDQNEH